MSRKIAIFMHVALMGDGRSIHANQVARLKKAGLWDAANTIRLGVVGEGGFIPDTKSTLEFRNDNLALYEYPTLELARQFSVLNPGCFVLYLHTKGASWPGAPGRVAWRNTMESVLIDKWERCLRIMRKHNHHTLGIMKFKGGNGMHYSGNFWWGRSKYIAKLPVLDAGSMGGRLYAERWVCSAEGSHKCIRAEARKATNYNALDCKLGFTQLLPHKPSGKGIAPP